MLFIKAFGPGFLFFLLSVWRFHSALLTILSIYLVARTHTPHISYLNIIIFVRNMGRCRCGWSQIRIAIDVGRCGCLLRSTNKVSKGVTKQHDLHMDTEGEQKSKETRREKQQICTVRNCWRHGASNSHFHSVPHNEITYHQSKGNPRGKVEISNMRSWT